MSTQVVEVDRLANFRAEVAAGKLERPRTMSERAKARLRALSQQEAAEQAATEKFLVDFDKLPKVPEVLVELYRRIVPGNVGWTTEVIRGRDGCVESPKEHEQPLDPRSAFLPDEVLQKMAQKLLWSLRHGWKPTSVGDVVFLGELTREEARMTAEQFDEYLQKFDPKNPVALVEAPRPDPKSSRYSLEYKQARMRFRREPDAPETTSTTLILKGENNSKITRGARPHNVSESGL